VQKPGGFFFVNFVCEVHEMCIAIPTESYQRDISSQKCTLCIWSFQALSYSLLRLPRVCLAETGTFFCHVNEGLTMVCSSYV
jgi:hypothetical protein